MLHTCKSLLLVSGFAFQKKKKNVLVAFILITNSTSIQITSYVRVPDKRGYCTLCQHFPSRKDSRGIFQPNQILTIANSSDAAEERGIFREFKYVENSVDSLRTSTFDFIKCDLVEFLSFLFA